MNNILAVTGWNIGRGQLVKVLSDVIRNNHQFVWISPKYHFKVCFFLYVPNPTIRNLINLFRFHVTTVVNAASLNSPPLTFSVHKVLRGTVFHC
jgi:hypothetical protein